jgi:prepilin-type N-terminal cleavage/methylation domain-containing protein
MTIAGSIKNNKRPRGVTLIELTIAIAIFSVVIIIALDSFLNVLKYNRETVQKQSIQDHAEFLFSLMSKEIRMAQINYKGRAGTLDCTSWFSGLSHDVGSNLAAVPANSTYLAVDKDGDGKHEELRFQNYEGLCVRYFMDIDSQPAQRLKVIRYNPDTAHYIDGMAPLTSEEGWVLPMDISLDEVDFTVQNMFDQRPSGALQPPLVKYHISLTSNIWSPSHLEFFNEITGRNIEQF